MDHYKIQLSRLEMDLKASMQRISSLEVENENLRSITHCAKLQAEVVQLREDLHRLQKAYDTLLSDKNQLENDLDGSCDAIQSMELKHEQDMASAIAKERTRWMRLESSSDILAKSEKVAQERVLDLQEQNDELHRQLQRARERITMYEKEYALEETSRYQKMLEADLWRREEDLRIARSQLSQEMERCKSLQHLCDRLVEKFKAAKANGSVENEFSIIEDISIHESQLEKQNEQLAKRVTELEEDQLKLMEQIRNANTRYFYAKNSTVSWVYLYFFLLVVIYSPLHGLTVNSAFGCPLRKQLKQKCESSTENKHPLGKNEDNLISTSSDGSPATTELSTIQHSLEALRSEFQDLQSRFSDMLITNSAPTDTVSEVFATIPPTDLMATFIREKIDELLSEKKTSSELSEFPEKQPKEGIKNIPTDSRTERRECRTDRSTSPLCTSDSTASPEFSKEHKRKTKNVGKLLRALAMCMKLIDESEQDLRERDRTIERFEESLKSMTEKVAVLSENNQELKENAKCKEGKLQQHIDQMLNEKELYIKKIVQLEQRCLDMQERAESSNSYLTLVKENLEDYKSRCEVLGVELDQHRRLTDEYMAQNNIPSLEKHNQTNLFQKSDGSVKQNLYQLLSEKDRFIKTLQAKLSETRSRLQARDFSKAEQTLKYIQAEHSEAVSMLQEIKSGFFSRSFENDYLTDARRQLYQVQQEKRFVEEKYAISVGEIDRLKRDIETLSSNMIELKGRFEKGEKQAACVKTLKAKDLEINRLRSTVRSLQKACSSKDLTVLRLETTSELEQKIKSLSDNLDKTSKSLLEHKRSKAKSDELLHKAAQRLQVAQDDITKKEVLETKLRQNLAEALSAKLNALEKARIATDKLKALQDKISTHSANMELITKQRAEIHDLNLKISSLRGLKNKKASC